MLCHMLQVYYHNPATGDSSWQKPEGFEGTVTTGSAAPVPVSSEDIPTTGWAEVTCSDGRKYYYHAKNEVKSSRLSSFSCICLENYLQSVPWVQLLLPLQLVAFPKNSGGQNQLHQRILKWNQLQRQTQLQKSVKPCILICQLA